MKECICISQTDIIAPIKLYFEKGRKYKYSLNGFYYNVYFNPDYNREGKHPHPTEYKHFTNSKFENHFIDIIEHRDKQIKRLLND